ncbi:MAG TPA: hypothetical protein VM182_15220 [Terriglobia bacterium]|nr:hypothetical protein [Terriglobia bacterium]
MIIPYNDDPRRNGGIYAESAAREAIDKFERLLICPNDFFNRARLAYLWSKGDRETGRGVGKTALLRYFRHRIIQDWGATEFSGKFSACVIYVSFPVQVDRRYMEQLALSALVDACRSGVLNASRAALRLQNLTAEQSESVLANSDGSQDPANLLEDSVLEAKGITPSQLDDAVTKQLVAAGVELRSAVPLAQGKLEKYLRSFRRDGSLEPFYVPRDTQILDYSRTLLFNDLVNYLREAGFAGGYLFIDDIENLVDQMTRKHRIEFAKEFALCTVRPGYANTAYSFFSCVLTTHQQASVGLAQAWGDAGLSAIARLDPSSPNSVELTFPSKDEARQIIVAHLDYYRINAGDKGKITPFTEDGIDALLEARETVHPRILLSRAATVVLHAVDKGINVIDGACVSAAVGADLTSVTAPDVTEGIEGAL